MKPALRRLLLAAPFTPVRLFRMGEQGLWYDPSDLSTLYQDSAGTTPVTAAGQPVGKILDKSGNANHSIQATAASRPTLEVDSAGKYYLNFDGTDDSLASSATLDLSGTSRITVIAGAYKGSDAATAILAETSANASTTAGAFFISGPNSNGTNSYGSRVRGDAAGATAAPTSVAFAAPHAAVLSQLGDIAGDGNTLRINGNGGTSTATDQGAGNFGNHTLYIGRRAGATLPFTGRLYGLIVRGAQTNGINLVRAEKWMAARAGIFI